MAPQLTIDGHSTSAVLQRERIGRVCVRGWPHIAELHGIVEGVFMRILVYAYTEEAKKNGMCTLLIASRK